MVSAAACGAGRRRQGRSLPPRLPARPAQMASRAGRVRNLHQPLHGAAAAMQRLVVNDAAQIASPSAHRVCHVCQRERARYTCPRCQAPYCGLACYKEHGTECTESFFRDQVIGELKNERPDEDEREQVASLLAQDAAARVEDAEMLDPAANRSEHALEEAAALLAREDLSDDDRVAQVLGVLTQEQQQAFLRAVSAGQLSEGSANLRPWLPWWSVQPATFVHQSSAASSRPSPLITEILEPEPEPEPDRQPDRQPPAALPESDPKAGPAGSDGLSTVLAPGGSDPPPLPARQLPTLSTVLRGTPSLSLGAHMVDLLYAYVYCKQLYNGDWGSGSPTDSADVAQCALQLSVVLTDPAAAATTIIAGADAVNSALHRSLAPSVFDSAKFSVDVLDGVACILRLGHGPLRAIHDFHTLFTRAAACTDRTERGDGSTKQAGGISKTVRRQLMAAVRKLWFFVIWCAETGGEDGSCLNWLQLAASVADQSQSLQAAASTGEELRTHISIIKPKMADFQAGTKATPETGTTATVVSSPRGEFKTNADTTGGVGHQHRPLSSSAVDERSSEQVSSLVAQRKRQGKLSSEGGAGEGSDGHEDTRADGPKRREDSGMDLPPLEVSPSNGIASEAPALSPNQLVAKLWPAHGDSKLTRDKSERQPELLHAAEVTEDCDSAAVPNPWKVKRENRAQKSKAVAAAVFRAADQS